MARLIVALDTDSKSQALAWVKRLRPVTRYFKVGSQLFTTCGPDIVRWIHKQRCRVFLDLKFHDIPQTIAHAVEAARRLGVFMVNVHASSGIEAMRAARRAAASAAKRQGHSPKVVAVTTLTSLDRRDMRQLGIARPIRSHVVALAKLAKHAGLDGVVASAQEVSAIRRAVGPKFLLVTPGIRLRGSSPDDQKRTARPHEAALADYIVVGRPITQAKDPVRVAKAIIKALR